MREGLEQQGFDATRAIDEQMDQHERIRLLYVACTRARDHLAVSRPPRGARQDGATAVHRRAAARSVRGPGRPAGGARGKPGPPASGRRGPGPAAGGRRHRAASAGGERPDGLACGASRADRDRSAPPVGLGHRAGGGGARRIRRGRRGGRHGRRRRRSVRASWPATPEPDDVEPGLAKRPVDLDLPAWRKGRYGTAIGRAVHGVLQVVDLATGEGLEALAGAQAAAEGIEDEWERIARLARSALAAPCVAEAAGRAALAGGVRRGAVRRTPCWRATSTCCTGGPDGLVVVDHKTDRIVTTDGGGPLPAGSWTRTGRQLAAYAVAVERATGEPVVAARLVFCAPAGGQEVVIAISGRRWRGAGRAGPGAATAGAGAQAGCSTRTATWCRIPE